MRGAGELLPLFFEYEEVANRAADKLSLDLADIDNILDYICTTANKREIFYLWRPYLRGPKDDLVLELAVKSRCDYIITYNERDFKAIKEFGIEALTPKEFLQLIGEVLRAQST